MDQAQEIAQRWINRWSSPAGQKTPEAEADDSWFELPKENPELCYSVILLVLKSVAVDPANPVFRNLAAGPLEDLLAAHGSSLIERIETEARRNPTFNLLLGGVWQNTMTPQIWGRIQAARLKVW